MGTNNMSTINIDTINLKPRWDALIAASMVDSAQAASEFNAITEAYTQQHRHYHTLAHIAQMLVWLSEAGIGDVASLWAVWYHDYIYKPGRNDNEARSAVQAKKALHRLCVTPSVISQVVDMINATKSHNIQAPPNAPVCAVLDADMGILGVETVAYRNYCRAVRAEYRLIPEIVYRRGRRGFLRELLSRPAIYKHPWFVERFECQAQQNIRHELAGL